MPKSTWPLGFSWTKTHWETVYGNQAPSEMRVQGGPFLFIQAIGMEFYFGFRPTAPGPIGWGNEGDLGTGGFGRWMKKVGWGNFGVALRPIKAGEEL